MKVQVLIAAMHQKDRVLLDKMNIQTDAIVGNQCPDSKVNSVDSFWYKGHSVQYLNFSEQGVGLNRNNALMRATGDICLFADDDMIYVDGYEKIIVKRFQENPQADILIFNLYETIQKRPVIRKKVKVSYWNYLRYGTARIAVRLKSIRENAIYFNQCFGGGTEHCHGEDNLFLNECLNKGLKIYALPDFIATLTEDRKSTWQNGYDIKYLRDQGSLYYRISKRWWKILCFQDAVRHHKLYKMSTITAFRYMINKNN